MADVVVRGQATVDVVPSGFIVPDVADVIVRLEPATFPFTTLLQAMKRGRPMRGNKRVWNTVGRYPRAYTVNGATTAGAVAGAKNVVLDSVGVLKVGDVLRIPNNATAPALTLLVTAVTPGTSTIQVYALPTVTGSTDPYGTATPLGTVPAFADNEVLYWSSNAKTEGDYRSDPRSVEGSQAFNFPQTFDATVEITDHAMRQDTFGGDRWLRHRQENLYELRKSLEVAFIFNGAPTATADPTSTKKRLTMAGLKYFTSESVDLPSSATQANIVDFIYAAFDGQNGSRQKLLMGGSEYMGVLDKINSGTHLTVTTGEKVAGLEITDLVGRKGRMRTLYNPTFDEQGASDQAVIVDMANIERSDLQPMEKRELGLKEDGYDAEGEYYITKTSLAVPNSTTHKWSSLS